MCVPLFFLSLKVFKTGEEEDEDMVLATVTDRRGPEDVTGVQSEKACSPLSKYSLSSFPPLRFTSLIGRRDFEALSLSHIPSENVSLSVYQPQSSSHASFLSRILLLSRQSLSLSLRADWPHRTTGDVKETRDREYLFRQKLPRPPWPPH